MRVLRCALLPLAAMLVAVLSGCPADDPCAAEEPSYGGLGNDDVWLTLQENKADATAGDDAPTITAPAASDVLPEASAPTFEWESPLKIALGPHAPTPLLRARTVAPLERVFTSFANVVVPQAHAHLPPVSSDVYLVDVLVPGRACPVSIVTSEVSHTLDADAWALLQDADGELTMQLTSAYLSSGNITEGPFKAADVTFTVE